jgi:hypothetical protein
MLYIYGVHVNYKFLQDCSTTLVSRYLQKETDIIMTNRKCDLLKGEQDEVVT